jgi:hypothetical protein
MDPLLKELGKMPWPMRNPKCNEMGRDVLTYDKEAVRKELKASRKRHTVRVKSYLP